MSGKLMPAAPQPCNCETDPCSKEMDPSIRAMMIVNKAMSMAIKNTRSSCNNDCPRPSPFGPVPAIFGRCRSSYPYGLDRLYSETGSAMVSECAGWRPGPFPVRTCYQVISPIKPPSLPPICGCDGRKANFHKLPDVVEADATMATMPGCTLNEQKIDTHFRQMGPGATWRIIGRIPCIHDKANIHTLAWKHCGEAEAPGLCGNNRWCEPSQFFTSPCQHGMMCEDTWPREDYMRYLLD